MVVEIVEANLAPRDQLGMLRQTRHIIVVGFGGNAGFMRMEPGACVDPIVLLGDFEGTVVGAWAGAAADGKNALQASLAGTGKHLKAVRIEFVSFNVGVGIDVQKRPRCL